MKEIDNRGLIKDMMSKIHFPCNNFMKEIHNR